MKGRLINKISVSESMDVCYYKSDSYAPGTYIVSLKTEGIIKATSQITLIR